MSHDLSSVNDRLDRADEHLQDIKLMLRAYYASHPYEFRGEYNPETGLHHMLRNHVFPPPERLHTLVGEFLHDLRSCLDHLAWQLVFANSGTPDEQTKWPILKTGPTANKQGIRPPPHVSGGASGTTLALIDREQPYTWGASFYKHPLWMLERLAIIDRHRHITMRSVTFRDTSMQYENKASVPRFTWTARTVESNEWGAQLELRPDEPRHDVYGSTTLQVIVKETDPDGIGRPLPVFDCLTHIERVVRGHQLSSCSTRTSAVSTTSNAVILNASHDR